MRTTAQQDQVLHDILGVTVDEANATLKAWNKMLTEAAKVKPFQTKTGTEGIVKHFLGMPQTEVDEVQNIPEKSVNYFTASDIDKTNGLAIRYWSQMGVNKEKSPFFRAWFGDWRAYDTAPVQVANQKGILRGVQKNVDTGWDIQVSSKVKSETIAHQSTASKMAIPYLDYIDDIVKHAILLDTYSIGEDNAKSINSLLMHYFYCVADIGNGAEIIKLDIEEMNDPNQFATRKRAYKLINIERWQPGAKGSGVTPSPVTQAANIQTVADLFDAVKSRDKNFKPKPVNPVLLNEDGTPKKFYHGTGVKFTVFDPAEMQEREGSFFFAENREDAQAYGRYVYEVYLQGGNLADYDNQPREFYQLKTKREQVAWLKDRGYDGWYADMDSGGWGEVSIFENTQVKSATDNIGTFDGSNPDIRYSLDDSIDDMFGNPAIQKTVDYAKYIAKQMANVTKDATAKLASVKYAKLPDHTAF